MTHYTRTGLLPAKPDVRTSLFKILLGWPAVLRVKRKGLHRIEIPDDKEWPVGVRQVTTPKIADVRKEKDRYG